MTIVDAAKDMRAATADATTLAALDVPHSNPFIAELVVDRAHAGEVVDHVDNTQYVRWLDRVAQMHSDSSGYSRGRLIEMGIMWFVARHEIDYLAEVWPGDTLQLLTWVRDIRRVKSWRDYVMYRPRDHRVVCRASTLWVLVDLENRRPARVPNEMVERFDPLLVRP